jgi:hypothetical protein
MRQTHDEKLLEARRLFLAYQFRPAYHLYHQLFSTLPFQISQSQLEHVSHYARTLLELDRLEELRFYLPILERHYEKAAGPYLAYALAYIHYLLGSKARALRLFERVAETAGEDGDLFIKAKMMLARMATVESECIRHIHSIRTPAVDPQLAKLLEVWRCIVLRYQGKLADSIERLRALILAVQPEEEWYCLLAAKDALVRGQLHGMDFEGARREIEGLGTDAEWGKFRTVVMHVAQLNAVYREHLGRQTIVGKVMENSLYLSRGRHTTRVQHPALLSLIRLFEKRPSLTMARATRVLSLSEVQIGETLKRFSSKLRQLELPKDSLDWQGNRVQLVPVLRVATANEGRLERW